MVRTLDTIQASKQKTPGVRAGTAQVDITPMAGTHLGGTIGTYRPAELVIDPIYAKALVLDTIEQLIHGSRYMMSISSNIDIM
jgi:hypothetical protein